MKPLPPEIVKLREYYQAAETKIIAIINNQKLRGNSTKFRESILKSIRAEIDSLDKYAAEFVKKQIPASYQAGANATYTAFRAANVPIASMVLNNAVIQVLQSAAFSMFTEAHAHVGRVINDQIRQSSVEAIAEKLTLGDTIKQTQNKLLSRLSESGITAITDKNGRQINLTSYAETVARSTTREATNTAIMETVNKAGYDLVQINSIGTTCEICAALEGRVYSMGGKNPKYPPLDKALGNGYANIHPNCRHNLIPYFPNLDDDKAKTLEFSNRSFDIDPRTQVQKNAYDRAGLKKTQLRNDRNQWQKYKIMLPDETPKTLSAFRSMKKAESEKFQNLQSDVKWLNKEIKAPIGIFEPDMLSKFTVNEKQLVGVASPADRYAIIQEQRKAWKLEQANEAVAQRTKQLTVKPIEIKPIETLQFESSRAAESYITGKHAKVSVNYEDMDIKLVNDTNVVIDRMVSEFPILGENGLIIDTGELSKAYGATALSVDSFKKGGYVVEGKYMITVPEVQLDTRTFFSMSDYKEGLETEWKLWGVTNDGTGYIQTHEMTHAVTQTIAMKRYGMVPGAPYSKSKINAFIKLGNEHDTERQIMETIRQRLGFTQSQLKTEALKFGKYAVSEPKEMLAESVAHALTQPNPSELAKVSLQVLKEYAENPALLESQVIEKVSTIKSEVLTMLSKEAEGLKKYESALLSEPVITKDIFEISNITGSEVRGLEFKFKERDKYFEKIDRKELGYEVKDILRYTYTSEADQYMGDIKKSVYNFKKKGYNVIEVENKWIDKQNPYNGVNMILKAPDGQLFELQYHTPESWNIKQNLMHELYAKQRNIKDITSIEYVQLKKEMMNLSKDLKMPRNIQEVIDI